MINNVATGLHLASLGTGSGFQPCMDGACLFFFFFPFYCLYLASDTCIPTLFCLLSPTRHAFFPRHACFPICVLIVRIGLGYLTLPLPSLVKAL
ncbi:hypothetical protein F5Y17DRAFT_434369 [Xylariaceae sp. FL0594]|nr:hypothetical protein F5Y17DRAFT_434369 [Xylariaceae sp. FL0594]